MIKIKNKLALDKMREAGRFLCEIFKLVGEKVEIGVSTADLDAFIEKEMIKAGLVPVCKGYGGYSHATCISLNDVVIHGVPSDKIILKSGDFVKIDVAGSFKGYCADMTRYFFVGSVSPEVEKIASVAQRALDTAIDKIRPGVRLSDISVCIQNIVENNGYGIVRDFAGHGIGKNLHEDPQVPNFGESGGSPVLREGMTLAIEPMITQGDYKVKKMSDGWTIKTVDGGFAAHVEDTIAVVKGGAEVLTRC